MADGNETRSLLGVQRRREDLGSGSTSDGEPVMSDQESYDSQENSQSKESTWVTIFAIWSSTMGTSLLAMPWAFQQAGIVQGIILQIFLAGISIYTGILVLRVSSRFSDEITGAIPEFAIVCRILMGKFGIFVTTASSILLFVGVLIVFWILMSELLFNSVNSVRYYIEGSSIYENSTTEGNVSNIFNISGSTGTSEINERTPGKRDAAVLRPIPAWSENRTVPFILAILLAPLVQLRSASFFTRFGAVGCIPVVLLVAYSIGRSAAWGINVNFDDTRSVHHIDLFNANFPALSGVLTMAFFLHNSIVTFFRHARYPENNERNLMIAYLLVLATYAIIGISIYISFPYDKNDIRQNFFENIPVTDFVSLAAQFLLFLRFVTLFPLLAYLLRVQVFVPLSGVEYPGHLPVILLNVCVIAACISCAVFYPHIGDIIRYSGAFCGMVFMYILPCALEAYLQHVEERRDGLQCNYKRHLLHLTIAVFGVGNFCAQFSVS